MNIFIYILLHLIIIFIVNLFTWIKCFVVIKINFMSYAIILINCIFYTSKSEWSWWNLFIYCNILQNIFLVTVIYIVIFLWISVSIYSLEWFTASKAHRAFKRLLLWSLFFLVKVYLGLLLLLGLKIFLHVFLKFSKSLMLNCNIRLTHSCRRGTITFISWLKWSSCNFSGTFKTRLNPNFFC